MSVVDINGTNVEFPDDLSPDDLNRAVAQAASQMGGAAPDNRGLLRKGWDALKVPEQKSREGLQMLAQMSAPQTETTGNLPRDIAANAPRIGLETLSEVAPSFVSRGSMLTAGIGGAAKSLAPLGKAMLRGAGSQGESIAGIKPGALEAAYKDSSLIFSKGKKAAGEFYEAAKAQSPAVLKVPRQVEDIVKEGLEKLQAGTLTPTEALTARKAADAMYNSKRFVKDEVESARRVFDKVAKSSADIAKGDEIHQRGVMAESLRHLSPQNKYGGASAFKLGIMTALQNMGPLGKALSFAISPAVQGASATAAGVGARQVVGPLVNNPKEAAALYAALAARRKSKEGK